MRFSRLTSKFFLGLCAVAAVACADPNSQPVQVIKGGGGTNMATGNGDNNGGQGAGSWVSQMSYSDKPDSSGLFTYIVSVNTQDLKPLPNNKSRNYIAMVAIALKPDKTFKMIYNEYLVQKDSHGNYCTKPGQNGIATVDQWPTYSTEVSGQWALSGQQIIFGKIASGTKLPTTIPGLTLHFTQDLNMPGLSGPPHVAALKKYNVPYDAMKSGNEAATVTEAAAEKALDKDCGATVPADGAHGPQTASRPGAANSAASNQNPRQQPAPNSY